LEELLDLQIQKSHKIYDLFDWECFFLFGSPATFSCFSLALPINLSFGLPVDQVTISGLVDQQRVPLFRSAEASLFQHI
jgi:hypothetical protein